MPDGVWLLGGNSPREMQSTKERARVDKDAAFCGFRNMKTANCAIAQASLAICWYRYQSIAV
jgi:hypothetical protein